LPQYKTSQTTDDRQTDDRKTTRCAKVATDSTVGQKRKCMSVRRHKTQPYSVRHNNNDITDKVYPLNFVPVHSSE